MISTFKASTNFGESCSEDIIKACEREKGIKKKKKTMAVRGLSKCDIAKKLTTPPLSGTGRPPKRLGVKFSSQPKKKKTFKVCSKY